MPRKQRVKPPHSPEPVEQTGGEVTIPARTGGAAEIEHDTDAAARNEDVERAAAARNEDVERAGRAPTRDDGTEIEPGPSSPSGSDLHPDDLE